MNNRGQTLVLFLLIMPIIIAFLAFFIDMSMVSYEKSKVNGVITNNLMVIVNKDIVDLDKIESIFNENEIKVNNIVFDNEFISIYVDYNTKSLFGKILDFDIYKIKGVWYGDYVNKKVNKVGWYNEKS